MELVRPQANVHALIRDGRPISFEDQVLTIAFSWDFHFTQMQKAVNQAILVQACRQVLGEGVSVRIVRTEPADPKPEPTGPSAVSSALRIFPGSQVTRLGSRERRSGPA